MVQRKINFKNKLLKYFPLILLYFSVLNEFDFQNDPDCSDKIGKGDFCSKKTGAYIGKYHIGYTFNTDVPFSPIDEWTYYQILGFGPALLTKARSISIIQAFLAILIYVIFNELNGRLGNNIIQLSNIINIAIAYKHNIKIYKNNKYWIHKTSIGLIPSNKPILNPEDYVKQNFEIFFEKYTPKEKDVVIEFGSGIGCETLYISKKIGENGKIYAIEPFLKVFNYLQKTM